MLSAAQHLPVTFLNDNLALGKLVLQDAIYTSCFNADAPSLPDTTSEVGLDATLVNI